MKKSVVTCSCGQRFHPKNLVAKRGWRRNYVQCPSCKRKFWLETLFLGREKY